MTSLGLIPNNAIKPAMSGQSASVQSAIQNPVFSRQTDSFHASKVPGGGGFHGRVPWSIRKMIYPHGSGGFGSMSKDAGPRPGY